MPVARVDLEPCCGDRARPHDASPRRTLGRCREDQFASRRTVLDHVALALKRSLFIRKRDARVRIANELHVHIVASELLGCELQRHDLKRSRPREERVGFAKRRHRRSIRRHITRERTILRNRSNQPARELKRKRHRCAAGPLRHAESRLGSWHARDRIRSEAIPNEPQPTIHAIRRDAP